ncbi:MAG: glycosyltransferase family 2 protein [Anaerolineae bacterium]|nr:glycosyltransferase family 2 protein [Anaerolineae bacterium]
MTDSTEVARVTIVIPNWNTRKWLPGCLDGLRAQTFQDFAVLLVDNGSSDDSVAFVQTAYPEVRTIALPENRGFAAAVNVGIAASRSPYVALLNVDTQPSPTWLDALVTALDTAPLDVGGIASKMLQLTDPARIDNAGDTFSWYGSARKQGLDESASTYDTPCEVFSICAGAALYRRDFLQTVGDFDGRFGSYLEDIDLGLRGRLFGYRYLYEPNARILHQSHGAGTPHARYVTLMMRNRLAVLLKNIPARLLLKHLGTLLYGQFYYFLAYKRPWHSLKGWGGFMLTLPQVMRQRREILKRKQISNTELEALLSDELGEIPLPVLLRSKARQLLRKS